MMRVGVKRETRTWRWIALSGIILTLAFSVAYRPFLISYHRAGVRDSRNASSPREPRSWKGYLSVKYWRWRIQGRPIFAERWKNGRIHEDALVRFGYFERRAYYPSNFSQYVVQKIRTNSIKDDLMFFSNKQDGRLEVIAHKDDFPLIEAEINLATEISPFE